MKVTLILAVSLTAGMQLGADVPAFPEAQLAPFYPPQQRIELGAFPTPIFLAPSSLPGINVDEPQLIVYS